MRSLKEIEGKIELMTSPNWPEGDAAVELLNEFRRNYTGIDILYLLGALDIHIKEAYQAIIEGRDSTAETIKANIAVWMMGDHEFVADLLDLPYEPPHLNKIKAMAKQYGVVLPGE